MKKTITCIECPMGCQITVEQKSEGISASGNGCVRGKLYAENEIKYPVRVLTTTVKHNSGKMLSVKTDKPIGKDKLFLAMKKISEITVKGRIKIGDIIAEDFIDGVNLDATDNL